MKCQITCSKKVISAIAINTIMFWLCTNALNASPTQNDNSSVQYNFNIEEINENSDII
ncbi:MAG TPA: hypothetical protein VHP36_02035 [Chitinispirillaceae bacterium]|nr:hypothetical protein [Chitinispirillaceae bacterium]